MRGAAMRVQPWGCSREVQPWGCSRGGAAVGVQPWVCSRRVAAVGVQPWGRSREGGSRGGCNRGMRKKHEPFSLFELVCIFERFHRVLSMKMNMRFR